MPNIYFTIQILASLLALVSVYLIVASLIKNNVNALWIRWESVAALVFSGAALSFVYFWFGEPWNLMLILSAIPLIIGFSLVLAIVIIHRIQLAHSREYSPILLPTVKKLSYAAFAALLAHIILEVLSLS